MYQLQRFQCQNVYKLWFSCCNRYGSVLFHTIDIQTQGCLIQLHFSLTPTSVCWGVSLRLVVKMAIAAPGFAHPTTKSGGRKEPPVVSVSWELGSLFPQNSQENLPPNFSGLSWFTSYGCSFCSRNMLHSCQLHLSSLGWGERGLFWDQSYHLDLEAGSRSSEVHRFPGGETGIWVKTKVVFGRKKRGKRNVCWKETEREIGIDR